MNSITLIGFKASLPKAFNEMTNQEAGNQFLKDAIEGVMQDGREAMSKGDQDQKLYALDRISKYKSLQGDSDKTTTLGRQFKALI